MIIYLAIVVLNLKQILAQIMVFSKHLVHHKHLQHQVVVEMAVVKQYLHQLLLKMVKELKLKKLVLRDQMELLIRKLLKRLLIIKGRD